MKTMIENVKKFAVLAILVFGISVFASAKSKTPVKVGELQKSITDYIAKDYAGYTIKDAFKVDNNNVILYDVKLVKGSKTVNLEFNKDGSFLKVVEPKATPNKTSTNSKSTATKPPKK